MIFVFGYIFGYIISFMLIFIFTLFIREDLHSPFKYTTFLGDVNDEDAIHNRMILTSILSLFWFTIIPLLILLLTIVMLDILLKRFSKFTYNILLSLKKIKITVDKGDSK